MKYFRSDIGEVKIASGKTMQFDLNKREVESDEFITIIDGFFAEEAIAATGKHLVWDSLKHGQPVIVDNVCLSIKM